MISLPPYDAARHPQIAHCVRSIVDTDQYDDWVVDPVYYRDFKDSDDRVAKAIQSAFAASLFNGERGTAIDLPRGPKPSIRAVYLPLVARVMNYVFCAGVIQGTRATTVRDKVYGFRYTPDNVPLFSTPYGEIALLAQNLTDVVRVENVHVIDARGYLNAISPDRLRQTLERAGASGAEVGVIYELSGLAGSDQGVPSGDDSHAALYDMILWSVDRELAERRLNFFRYRDDYFSPTDEAMDVIVSAGKKIGIEFVRKHTISDISLEKRRSEQHILQDGTRILGRLNCTGECTDRGEAEFEFRRPSLKRYLEREVRPNEDVDAVTLVPCLRQINEQRAPDVLRVPGDALISGSLRELQAEIRSLRPLLAGLAGGWRRNRTAAWTSSWATQSLSDLGALTPQETATLVELASAASAPGFARCSAVVALARCAPTDVALAAFGSATGAPPDSLGSHYHAARALCLAHHYLTIRNAPALTLPAATIAAADGLAAVLENARRR